MPIQFDINAINVPIETSESITAIEDTSIRSNSRRNKSSRLHLNWARRRNEVPSKRGHDYKLDFYTTSLEEQYETIQKKLDITYNFQQFIESICPSMREKEYFILIPGFVRELQPDDRNGYFYIDNIIIHIKRDVFSEFLSQYDFLIIGRLTVRQNQTELEIKGMELVSNTTIPKEREKSIRCICANALSLIKLDKGTRVPNYGSYSSAPTVLTQEFINSIPPITENFQRLLQWKDYIDWRKYYLKEESQRGEKISDQYICDSYIIPKEKIKGKSNEGLEELPILDKIEKFAKGEQIILSEPIEDAESFPLIRVDVQKNRKEIEQEIFESKKSTGKKKATYQSWLKRFTRDSMELSFSFTYQRSRSRDNSDSFVLSSSYSLGERYLFTYVDKEPDCSKIEQKYNEDCKNKCEEIENRYRQRITQETKDYITPIQEEDKARLESFNNNLEQFEKTQGKEQSIFQSIDTNSDEKNQEITLKLHEMIDNFEQKKKLEEENNQLRKEKEILESNIKSHEEEISKQKDVINKLNETKKTIHDEIDTLYKTQIQEPKEQELKNMPYNKTEELKAQYQDKITQEKDAIIQAQKKLEQENEQKRQAIREKYTKCIKDEKDAIIQQQKEQANENKEKLQAIEEKYTKCIKYELEKFLEEQKKNSKKVLFDFKGLKLNQKALEESKTNKQKELNDQYQEQIAKEQDAIIQQQKQQEEENGYKLLEIEEKYTKCIKDEQDAIIQQQKQQEEENKKKLQAIDERYKERIKNEVNNAVKTKQKEKDEHSKSFFKYLEQFENRDREIFDKLALTPEIIEQLNQVQSILDSEKETKSTLKQYEDKQKKLQSELKSKKENINTTYKKIQNLTPKKNELHNRIVYLYTNQVETYQSELEKNKRVELENRYREYIEREQEKIKNQLKKNFEATKEAKIEDETIRQYQIYFRPNNPTSEDGVDVKTINKQIAEKLKYIMKNENNQESEKTENIQKPTIELKYDPIAERAKINRQEKALNSLEKGYFRNPFLPVYLFDSKLLMPEETTEEKIEWVLTDLNSVQQEAVRKALASKNLFLLQGPPGTGKTQVITEITAQCVKRGLKVLISSETHKAIDNVFERLPKWPSIIPLRLIPSYSKKTTEYSPENLVDNLYLNIRHALEKEINRVNNFEDFKDKFQDWMSKLKLDYSKILQLEKEINNEQSRISSLDNEIKGLEREIEKEQDELANIQEKKGFYQDILRKLDKFEFDEFNSEELKELIQNFSCLSELDIKDIPNVMKMNDENIKKEISIICSNGNDANLEAQRNAIRSRIGELIEENPNHPEVKKLRDQLIQLKKKTNQDLSDLEIVKLFPNILNNQEQLKSSFMSEIFSFQSKVYSIRENRKQKINDEQQPWQRQEEEKKKIIENKKSDCEAKYLDLEKLRNNPKIKKSQELRRSLLTKITNFFKNFEINREYKHDSLIDAFKIMEEEWARFEQQDNFNEKTKRNIALYKDVAEYLSNETLLQQDRRKYTRYIYDYANVFGITCTSRDNYTQEQLNELKDYGIESVDLKEKNIDVVIIDEVSKSSFLDLLIPMLLGKKIILVGDHRQLPPMYDLQHMRDDDFEGLDEEKISPEKNKKYIDLYEECIFKTLYENIHPAFKVMLNKQYRCHSHIMEVFNHFYKGAGDQSKGLTIGKKQQDNEKEHNLTVKIKDKTLISPEKHIYFVNCKEHEARAYEGSTSFINDEEAEVAIALVEEINKFVLNEIKERKLSKEEKPSIGIICTYGDQASLIKKKKHKKSFQGFSDKSEEKFIISTVDDFQGDERDIIIVSMVRNPERSQKVGEFIKKFERINVALSRARKLLIVIGNRLKKAKRL